VVQASSGSLKADPNFDASRFSPEAALWYDRLVRGVQGGQYPDTVACSKSGDVYTLGRCAGMGILSLSMATRATGDPQFISQIDMMLDNMRADLKDVWRPECEKFSRCESMQDGYLNFTSTINPNDANFYGNDTLELDEILSHAAITAGVRALKENVDLHPEYQEKVSFWTDYLENHFLKKWKTRSRIPINDETQYSRILGKSLTHPYISFVSFYNDLYFLTGKQVYRDEALRRGQIVKQTLHETVLQNGTTGVIWRHGVAGSRPGYTLCQPVEYSTYTLAYLLKLNQEGFDNFNQDAQMEQIANTISYQVLPNSSLATGLTPTVCGTNTYNFPPEILNDMDGSSQYTKRKPYSSLSSFGGFIGFARWDRSGTIAQAVEASFRAGSSNWERPGSDLLNPIAGAYMLMAIPNTRGGILVSPSPTLVPTPSPVASPSSSPSVSPTPLVSPTPTPEISPSISACVGDINDDRRVDLADYSLLSGSFFRTASVQPKADLNQDGSINISDYSILVDRFFKPC